MKTTKAKTLHDLKALHDPDTVARGKIRAQLAAMLKAGPEEWDYQTEFAKKAGMGVTTLLQFCDEFKAHIGVTKAINGLRARPIWFADPRVAKKFRGE